MSNNDPRNPHAVKSSGLLIDLRMHENNGAGSLAIASSLAAVAEALLYIGDQLGPDVEVVEQP